MILLMDIILDEKYVTKGNLGKWLKQKWVDISRKDPKTGKHPPCGASAGKKNGRAGHRNIQNVVPHDQPQLCQSQKNDQLLRENEKQEIQVENQQWFLPLKRNKTLDFGNEYD